MKAPVLGRAWVTIPKIAKLDVNDLNIEDPAALGGPARGVGSGIVGLCAIEWIAKKAVKRGAGKTRTRLTTPS